MFQTETSMRVPNFLADNQIAYETLVHPPAFTAQKRAKYLHVSGKHVAKSVLLVGPNGHLLAILPATQHVDTQKLSILLNGGVRLATDKEIAEFFTDCEWGVVPPFGTLYNLPTIIEDTIDPDTFLVFESTSHAKAIRLLCRDFEQLERPQRLRFAVTRETAGRTDDR